MSSFTETLTAYRLSLEEEERSPETIRAYLSQLRQFAEWFHEHYGMPVDPSQMTSIELREYKQHITDREKRPATINAARSALGSFARWLERAGGPALKIPRGVREEGKPPRWLSRKEHLALMRAVERSPSKTGRAAVILLLHTGLRIGEAVALRFSDAAMTARKGTLTVRWGKGKKRREVPLNAEARDALHALRFDSRRGPVKDDDPVFVGQRGPMTERGLYRKIAEFGDAAKPRLTDFSPHVLRHTYCKRLAEAGARIEQIAALAGHDSLETTRRYLEPGREELAALVDRLAGGDDSA
jgi:integrase